MKRNPFISRVSVAIIITTVLCLFLIVAPAAADAPTATLALVPDYSSPPSVTSTFDVTVSGTSNIYTAGYQVWLEYDPAYIEPVGVSYVGTPFKDITSSPSWIKNNTEGVMGIFGMVPLNEDVEPFAGIEWVAPEDTPVDLCTITFSALHATGSPCTKITLLTKPAKNPLFSDPLDETLVTGIYGTSSIILPDPPAQQFLEPVDVIPGTVGLSVCIVCKGDFDADGDIDLDDLIDFAGAYNSKVGDLNYNAIGDFNDDGYVDLDDLIDFAGVYNTSCLIPE
ncbi:MAG: hypothetical protein PHV74_07705 [Dehalococcoidia bacterium]|nr:hypothetical protein [Dehalococcoidia bacterium]